MTRAGLSLLLALGCLTLSCTILAATSEAVEKDFTVTRRELNREGRNAVFNQITAKDCSARITQTQFDDNTTNSIVDDMNNEVGIILLAASADSCFVRNISGSKARCQKGGVSESEGVIEETTYTVGNKIDPDDLPEDLAEICINRTVLLITQVGPREGNNPLDHGKGGAERPLRSKRETVVRCVKTKINCHECSCVGWLFRARRCQICCEEKEECTTTTT